jgi:hypothetical protein
MQTQQVQPDMSENERHPFGSELQGRSALGLWVFVLLVAIAVPGMTYHIAQSAHAMNWYAYVNSLILTGAFAVVVLLFAYLLAGRRWRIALRIAAAFVLVTFLWPTFGRFDSVPVVGVLIVVGIPALIVVVAGAYGDRVVGTFALVGLATLMLGISAYGMVSRQVSEPSIMTFTPSENGGADAYPDVLFILLDGYARQDVLEELNGFDNSQFLSSLGDSGFEINRSATSNYNRTYASVASVMDLGYPIESGIVTSDSRETIRGLLGQGGSLVAAYREAGYEFTYSENGWSGSQCGSAVDHCWRAEVTRTNAYYLSQLTPIAPIVKRAFTHPMHSSSWTQINQLADVVLERSERQTPQLFWAHFLLPHPPVNLDASCAQHTDSWRHGLMLTSGTGSDQQRREAYVDQTICINETLTSQLDRIFEQNSNIAVFVFSDHGSDSQQQLMTFPSNLTSEQIHERYGILMGMRVGKECESVDSASTLLAGARLFVGCTLGLSVEPVAERSFIVSYFDHDIPVIEFDADGGG